MARIRSIKPELPQSESLGRVSRDARLLFISLWTLVDDAGRTRAASRLLASLLFPYDDDAPTLIDTWLQELEGIGAVRRYTVDGSVYLDIPNWLKHQKIDKASGSRLPAFPESSREVASPREDSPLDLGPRTVDLDREGKGEDQDTDPSARVVAAPRVSPHSRPGNLINGAEQRRHGTHAWCSQLVGRDGFCVPASLHQEFIGRLGSRANPAADLRAWYPTVVAQYDGRDVGDNLFAFWNNAFAAWVGVVTSAVTPSGGRMTAAQRTIATMRQGELS